MIERKFVAEKMREFLVNQYLSKRMGPGKYSSFEIKRTPLGERIVIYTARPGLIVGKGGENIKALTKVFKSKFKMENPQIEVAEIEQPNLDAQTMAESIVNTMDRFGPKRFKSTGYRTLQRIMDAGALGCEINISGRGLPGSRAKTWRFYAGYLKKSGDVSMNIVEYGYSTANLKSGSVGVKVRILPPGITLPDQITFKEKPVIHVEEDGEVVSVAEVVEDADEDVVIEEAPNEAAPEEQEEEPVEEKNEDKE